MPLVYYYGHTSPSEKPELYQYMVTNLATRVEERMQQDRDANASGVIVNTCGLVEGPGLDILKHCIGAFAADVILVMNNDKLYAALTSFVPEGVTVVKLPTSGGVLTRVSLLLCRCVSMCPSIRSLKRKKNL